ncbi:XkdN-like protein [Paenibacillus sp. HB172176]|uniref:phage tail assembly chaperone n=1 Tax=Paenibacillus sp. HB172176 TaxID=2493690 RepID=UPI0014392A74|nr:XkdN-like protein [Paenibacillus sp. HB172176]
MSTLQEFLNSNPIDNLTAEIAISDRFKDKAGKLLKFKIKAMTNDEFDEIRKRATQMDFKKGKKNVEFNVMAFNESIVINNTLDPDFRNADSIKAMGCTAPEQYLTKVLLAGEIAELSQQIQKLSGFEQDLSDLVEEAKN